MSEERLDEQGTLPERPLLAPWYRIAPTRSGLVLEYGDGIVALEGATARRLLPHLLPLLDGTRTVPEILAAADEPQAAAAALGRLAAEGLLLEGGDPGGAAASFHAAVAPLPTAPGTAAAAIAAASVGVVGSGAAGDEIERLLRTSGVGELRRLDWSIEDGLPPHVVAAPAPAELPQLAPWNERLLEQGVAWLQVLPHNGRFAAVGPFYVPGVTCCYECFRRRRSAALGGPAELDELELTPAHYPVAPAVAAAAAGVAVTLLLARILVPGSVELGTMFALELGCDARLDAHRVYRLPRCPACSPAATRPSPFPWALEAS